jgi:flagellar L-ring protein precursor FlgH
MFKRILFVLLAAIVMQLLGCASADRTPLVKTQTSARPMPPSDMPANPGSVFPVSQLAMTGAYRPLFEDRRARAVGDTLIVLLNEVTSASKNGGTVASKTSSTGIGGALTGSTNTNATPNFVGSANASGNSSTSLNGSGSSTAANTFNGFITVTVLEVLPNGNLVVAGEKELAVGYEEEYIRFGGTVNPNNLVNNTVASSQVADARIEYRGKGITDDVRETGWFSRLMMKISPF